STPPRAPEPFPEKEDVSSPCQNQVSARHTREQPETSAQQREYTRPTCGPLPAIPTPAKLPVLDLEQPHEEHLHGDRNCTTKADHDEGAGSGTGCPHCRARERGQATRAADQGGTSVCRRGPGKRTEARDQLRQVSDQGEEADPAG